MKKVEDDQRRDLNNTDRLLGLREREREKVKTISTSLRRRRPWTVLTATSSSPRESRELFLFTTRRPRVGLL